MGVFGKKDVVDVLASGSRPLSTSEVGKALGMPADSAYDLLDSAEKSGRIQCLKRTDNKRENYWAVKQAPTSE